MHPVSYGLLVLLQHTRTWLQAAPVPFGSGKSIENGIFPGREGSFDFPTQTPQPHLKVAGSVLAPKCKQTQESVRG